MYIAGLGCSHACDGLLENERICNARRVNGLPYQIRVVGYDRLLDAKWLA